MDRRIAASPPVAATLPGRPRRPLLQWSVAAAAIVALAAATFVGARLWSASPLPSVIRFQVPTPLVTNPAWLPMLAVSPDGRALVFVASEGGTTVQTLWLRHIDAVESQKLPGTEGALSPFWSPDSRQIAFAAQGRLKRIDLSGGPPQTITEVSGTFAGGTWNAEGTIVFGGLAPLMRVSAAGGQASAVTQLEKGIEVGHVWPTFLPDGRHVLFLAAGTSPDTRRIMVVDPEEGTPRVVMAASSNPLYSRSGHLLFHREGTLMAQPFDLSTLTVSGDPARIADGLAAPSLFRVAAAISDAGVMATRGSSAFEATRLTWFNRAGARTGAAGEPAVYRGLGLSPDGESLAVHVHEEPNGGDVWVLDLRRGASTKYTFGAHNFAPRWSRDGKYVMFSSDRDGGMNLYRKAAGAAGGDEMMLGSGTAAFVEDLTPDGEFMIYGAQMGSNGIDVMRVPLNKKGDPEVVVSSPFFDGLAKISPDGRWIAYESDDSGIRQIFARPYPSGPAKWQVSTDGGRYVRWSAKGDELFYLKDDGTLMSAVVRAEGAALAASTPKPLFKANPLLANHRGSALDIPYDVTRDAQRFIVNERMTSGTLQSPISVVVNWTSLLPK